jgi:hypothetical protein
MTLSCKRQDPDLPDMQPLDEFADRVRLALRGNYVSG